MFTWTLIAAGVALTLALVPYDRLKGLFEGSVLYQGVVKGRLKQDAGELFPAKETDGKSATVADPEVSS